MSTAVMTRNEETLDILKETERLSQSVIDRTADMSDKNSYIASNTPKAQNDKRQVTDSGKCWIDRSECQVLFCIYL